MLPPSSCRRGQGCSSAASCNVGPLTYTRLIRSRSFVEIRKSFGMIGQTNQGDPTHDHRSTNYNSKRYDCRMYNSCCSDKRHYPDNDADNTKTSPNHDFHFGLSPSNGRDVDKQPLPPQATRLMYSRWGTRESCFSAWLRINRLSG